MTTLAEYEKMFNPEPTDSDCVSFFAKGLDSGQYNHLTKSDYHQLIEQVARENQSPTETFECAYDRVIEKTDTGLPLYKAYKSAPDNATGRVEKHKFIAEIQKRADELYSGRLDKNGRPMTREQRFSRAIDVDRVSQALYQAAKAAPGRDTPPAPAPEPPTDTPAALAKRAGPANAQMLELARARQKVFPTESDAVAFVRVWEDPKNGALKTATMQENWNLMGVGDTEYMGRQSAPYSNPHPGGSGPRP